MRSAISFAAAGLTLTALILPAAATPFDPPLYSKFSISCPDDPASNAYVIEELPRSDQAYVLEELPRSDQSSLQGWCTSRGAVALGCSPDGKRIQLVNAALKDTHCDVCKCVGGPEPIPEPPLPPRAPPVESSSSLPDPPPPPPPAEAPPPPPPASSAPVRPAVVAPVVEWD